MSNSKLDFFRLLKTGISSINPSKLIQNSVQRSGNTLKIDSKFLFKNQNVNIDDHFILNKNVYIAAFGKAALGMALEMEKVIGQDLVKGIAIIPFNDAQKFQKFDSQIYPDKDSKINFYYGGKFNLPDTDSVSASKKIYKMVSELRENDLLIALISGGGSALLTLPEMITYNESTNFDLKLATIKKVVQSGATINELNTVRSCLSQVKNGKLALLAYPAKTISLIISDVIDDPLEIISSGPCCVQSVYSTSKQAEKAIQVLEKYELFDKVPKEIIEFLNRKISCQTDEKIKEFIQKQNVSNYLIGNNVLATLAIYDDLSDEIYQNDFRLILTNSLCGEAKSIGCLFAALAFSILKSRENNFDFLKEKNVSCEMIRKIIHNIDILNENEIKNLDRVIEVFVDKICNSELGEKLMKTDKRFKICFISGGETTVNMSGLKNIGKGGRNQELTLAFEYTFKKVFQNINKEFEMIFSSFGSDGIDGPTDAAGAFFSHEDKSDFNLDEIANYLNNHDSYNYFLKYERLIKTGPTGTNVSDLQILLLNF